ncbi:P2Y purinoceptor 1 [Synchiropus splendidus]|uniref:P2Y purinoceptor 1 n=1 Tax=Synchiropus splendidus TaxID=270530 RepID=UPI00237D825B|nr:P2Y purinoceptor 1 [Synchiropus splendidus]
MLADGVSPYMSIMNRTSCFNLNHNFESRVLPSIYTLVFLIGFPANIWGIKSLLQKWTKLGCVNVFILNLGLSNLVYLPTVPFLVVYYFMKSTWIFGDTFCKMTRFCFNLNLYGSIGFLTCISVYRYLAVIHPMRVLGRLRVAHSIAISVLVWLLVSVQSLPDITFPKSLKKDRETCYHTTTHDKVHDYLVYSVGWTPTGFCLPFCIMLGCYGHVIAYLCRRNTIDKLVRQRVLTMLVITVVLFSVCYIPHHLYKNLALQSRILTLNTTCLDSGWFNGVYVGNQISRGLVCLNLAINPLVYLHTHQGILKKIRQRLRQAAQHLCCCAESRGTLQKLFD